MPVSLTLEQRALLDATCDRFEKAWRCDAAISIESLLGEADAAIRPDLLRELLLLELELLSEAGIRPPRNEYLARFPHDRAIVLAAFRTSIVGPSTAAEDAPDFGLARGYGRSADFRQTVEVLCPNCHRRDELAFDPKSPRLECAGCGHQLPPPTEQAAAGSPDSLAVLGRFELIERVGSGGFGTVWKAFDYELERTVAIKVPRWHDLDADEQERFLREALVAAQLRHPNIVAIHETGRDHNLVYIVSDFVDGVTLSDWMSDQQPTHRETAQLCVTIASALHHAHEKGVVHRDLKPANVLIDAQGQPHLTDFGLARRDLAGATKTIGGLLLGTPAYMSPEQAQCDSHSVDRRSDLYSLGVILFQLLTRELPFRGKTPTLLQQVIHDEPPSPRHLDGTIPKDLETISLKCLEKKPGNRYASAQDLVDELHRFLRAEPICARPISSWERGWRWSQRHPAIVSSILLGLTLMLTLAGGMVVTFSAMRAADRNRQIAEQKERTTRRTLQFLQRLFGSSDPVYGSAVGWRQSGDAAQLSLNDVLDRAAPAVMQEVVQDEPAVGVEVLCALGDVYRSVGLYDGAEKLLAQARGIASGLADDPGTRALAEYRWGWLCHDLGRYDEAGAAYDRARELRFALYSGESLEVAEVDFNRAWLMADLIRKFDSIALFRQVLDVQRRHLPDDSFQVQSTALALKIMLLSVDKADDAMLVEILVRGKPNELSGLVDKHWQARQLRVSKRLEEALVLYREIYDQASATLPSGHPLLVYLQVDLSGLLKEMDRAEEGERLMRAAIDGSRKLFDSNPKMVRPLMEFAKARAASGDPEEAAMLYERALIAAQGRDPEITRMIREGMAALPNSESQQNETQATTNPPEQ